MAVTALSNDIDVDNVISYATKDFTTNKETIFYELLLMNDQLPVQYRYR